jgi:hypothetical protein
LIEPHFLTPFIHFLPVRWRIRLARNFTLWGWLTRPSEEESERFVRSINLLSAKEIAGMFPDAEIRLERVIGLTKSVIAYKDHQTK